MFEIVLFQLWQHEFKLKITLAITQNANPNLCVQST